MSECEETQYDTPELEAHVTQESSIHNRMRILLEGQNALVKYEGRERDDAVLFQLHQETKEEMTERLMDRYVRLLESYEDVRFELHVKFIFTRFGGSAKFN